jgi:hydroxymethylbilane synthase
LTLVKLPAGSIVGTGSPRRVAQLAALGLGLRVTDIRGNVGSRISMVHNGSCDAVLLARAGLARLGRLDEVTESIDLEEMLPAPGQGALAVECREDRPELLQALAPLDDPGTRACVSAERALLAALEAGCTAPVGALAEIVQGDNGPELFLRAFAGNLDATVALRRSGVGSLEEPERLGRDLAAILLKDGAADISLSGSLDQTPGLGDGPPPPGNGLNSSLAATAQSNATLPHRSSTERAL